MSTPADPIIPVRERDFRVAIVGGGICGLLCAIGLTKGGFEVDIFESAVSVAIQVLPFACIPTYIPLRDSPNTGRSARAWALVSVPEAADDLREGADANNPTLCVRRRRPQCRAGAEGPRRARRGHRALGR